MALKHPTPPENNVRDPENWCWYEPVADGIFVVARRWNHPVPNQDQYRMHFESDDGSTFVNWGTHPSDIGARKFFNNRIEGGTGREKTK